ncbi:hypothetical protein L332_01055 [Agrococcus pavilionensis RW1]|uniref:Protein kinase domain-containing protein n=1 Tax=Agrococcus pavilionensis RW1 TaxID=1330458 RepID=U1LL62_9MICO|nr:hypothetical protein [Agrococcus pavilionensis]ERG63049.1 hypothetical protein L332_01055 [Agrococcus pavilionensis RW1]
MDPDAASIAGYPLVRAVRRTAEREVWVADASGHGVEVHRALAGADAPLAREAEALLLAEHEHLLPVVDVATDVGVVVVRQLVPRDLADWLLERGEPESGEAVTALAPIAAALGALHAIGAVAGGVTAHDVRIDDDGAPMLVGEGAHLETDRPTEAWREASDGVAADARGWRELALLLADASGQPLPQSVEAAVERRDLVAAGAALIAAWPALPLALDPPVVRGEPAPSRMRPRERASGLEAVWARVALLLERLPRGAPVAARLLDSARAVRPRYWAVSGGGVVALVVAAVLLGGSGPPVADAAAEPSPTPTLGDVAAAQPTAVPTAHPPPGGVPADPLAGAAALLAEREACLDAGDAACLVGLHEPDSPLLTALAPWRMPDDGVLEVVQQLGDAWLLRVVSGDEPASVLVMSTEAGWTLRDAWSD